LITILRQYFSYNIVTSRTYDVTLDITMKVTEKQPFLLLPVDDYRADLRITDSEGKSMIILSDYEFEQTYGKSLAEITELFLTKIKDKTSKRTQRLTKNYRVIAVMLNQQFDEYYEKVKVTWTHKSTIDNYFGKITKFAKIDLFIPRFGFTHNKTSAIYMSFKTNSTYRIHGEPKIRNWAKTGRPKYKEILNSVGHKVYRFQETDEPQLIQVTVIVGMPNTILKWTSVGLASGILIPFYMLSYLIITGTISIFAFESLAGVTAILIGERVLILKDIPLMKSWSNLNLGLVFWTLFVLVMMIIGSNGSSVASNCVDVCEIPLSTNLESKLSDLIDTLKNPDYAVISIQEPIFGRDFTLSDSILVIDRAQIMIPNENNSIITPLPVVP